MAYCRICTRNFYREAEKKVKDGICDYCRSEMERIKESVPMDLSQEELEELVAQRKRSRLEGLSPWELRRRIKESKERDET